MIWSAAWLSMKRGKVQNIQKAAVRFGSFTRKFAGGEGSPQNVKSRLSRWTEKQSFYWFPKKPGNGICDGRVGYGLGQRRATPGLPGKPGAGKLEGSKQVALGERGRAIGGPFGFQKNVWADHNTLPQT